MSSIIVSGDTSGSVTLQAPAVAGSTVLTLPASTGTVMVNGPAFSATAGALTIATSTFTKIPFSSLVTDTNSNYNTSLYRFTPTVAGYYLVKVQFFLGVSGGRTAASIYKNGSDVCQTLIPSSNTNGGVSVVSQAVVYLNGSSDYVEAYGYQESGGNGTINTAANLTSFQGYMVRSA
jgi:hypothetical protein